MTTISDTFDRADDSGSLGTASDGGSWTVLSGTFGITSNQAYIPLVSGSPRIPVQDALSGEVNLVAAMRDLGSALADMTIDAQRSSASDTYVSAIFVNCDPATSACYWFAYTGDGWGMVGYTSSGASTAVAGGPGIMPSIIGSYHTLRLVVNSPGDVTAYCDGSPIAHATGMPSITSTNVGIAGAAPGVLASPDRWNNFSAVNATPAPARRAHISATRRQAIVRASVI